MTIEKDSAVFTRDSDAWTWLEKKLKDIPKENIIEQKVVRNENCGDPDNTAYYTIKK
jgi:hypothetical protein